MREFSNRTRAPTNLNPTLTTHLVSWDGRAHHTRSQSRRRVRHLAIASIVRVHPFIHFHYSFALRCNRSNHARIASPSPISWTSSHPPASPLFVLTSYRRSSRRLFSLPGPLEGREGLSPSLSTARRPHQHDEARQRMQTRR